ncbi:hypothetical protein ALON55S_05025 [Alishewanella longhuensis]
MRWAFKPAVMRHLLNFWPPFFFSGIKVAVLSDDYRYCKVELKSRPWTKNINRSQFGGWMFAMTDPIYPLMLMGALGGNTLFGINKPILILSNRVLANLPPNFGYQMTK